MSRFHEDVTIGSGLVLRASEAAADEEEFRPLKRLGHIRDSEVTRDTRNNMTKTIQSTALAKCCFVVVLIWYVIRG